MHLVYLPLNYLVLESMTQLYPCKHIFYECKLCNSLTSILNLFLFPSYGSAFKYEINLGYEMIVPIDLGPLDTVPAIL